MAVVCEESATFATFSVSPTLPANPSWTDSQAQYVHSVAGFGVAPAAILCGNDGTTPFVLYNPPTADALFKMITGIVSGR
jgi:hypothetical protein